MYDASDGQTLDTYDALGRVRRVWFDTCHVCDGSNVRRVRRFDTYDAPAFGIRDKSHVAYPRDTLNPATASNDASSLSPTVSSLCPTVSTRITVQLHILYNILYIIGIVFMSRIRI